jgi:hypothetical protein
LKTAISGEKLTLISIPFVLIVFTALLGFFTPNLIREPIFLSVA